MILKASQRGGSTQLAAHLLKTHDNEHVAVHELRGFSSDDLQSALHEIYAVSRGTRAKQFLFSLSLNPPPQERVEIEAFEEAIDAVEQKLGLTGQPRAVVFHEKEGRRHAHVVWSRIDTEKMKAINMAHFKLKLRDLSRELYLDHGWRMPRGLMNSQERDPKNYTREEWEQAKRAKQDPRALKAMFQECWSISDGPKAFANALQARGYTLAKGERGHVAVDFRGEIYAVAKWVGVKAKEMRAKLGEAERLPTIAEAKATIAAGMTAMLRGHIANAEAASQKKLAALALHKSQLVEKQRKERADLEAAHEKRWAKENAQCAARLNKGFRGIWDRLTGRYGKQARDNEREALEASRRDRREKDALIERHLDERQGYHIFAKQVKATHGRNVEELHRDVADYMRMPSKDHGSERPEAKEHSHEETSERSRRPRRPRKDRGPDREI
jgi:hypothetical protein